ncbi:MAG: DNA cytosine methyltransferase [Nannocystaceae bacterium]
MPKTGTIHHAPASPLTEIPVISLFTGAGGLDLGFRGASFRTIFAADKMDAAVRTFNHNHDNGQVAEVCDLLKVQGKELVRTIRESARTTGLKPMGLIGGPPCQGVSNANNQAGPSDPRNRLFSRFAGIVLQLTEAFDLRFFVFENVPGLKRSKNRPLYDRLVRRLRPAFHLHEEILDASLFGVPQTRRRLIMVGFSKRYGSIPFEFPAPVTPHPPTVRDTIGGLPPPVFFSRTEKVDPRTRTIHPNHWTMAPRSSKFSGVETRHDGRSFIRLQWDLPSRTVAYGNREIHVHPDGTRRLSVYEAMRLQGFPPGYELVGTLSDQVTLVSNAVPPPLAAAVARSVANSLRNVRGK